MADGLPFNYRGQVGTPPADGAGFLIGEATRQELLKVKPVGGEVFLHYRLQRDREW
jgi:hypothetical protein